MSLGIAITEKEYRALKYDSSSSLKDFSKDRRKYHKKYVLGEKVKEKENKASNMGRLVETLLMEPDRFDDLFFMSSCIKIPGGMLGDFIWNLSELVSDKGDKLYAFEEVANEAYKKVGFKIKFETVITKLEDPINKLYYDECLKVNHLKMTMVTVLDVDNAEKIVHELKTNLTTAGICTLEDDSSTTLRVYNQMKIKYFIDDMKLKSMLDKVIVNHKEKTVHIYDLKCTWAVEAFYKEYYLYRQAYIQAYLYWKSLLYLAALPDSSIYGYAVKYPQFIVCDSINYYNPLIYTLTKADLKDAYNGFTYKYTYYPGVKQIIEELKWAIKSDIWNISKTNYDKKGILNIKD